MSSNWRALRKFPSAARVFETEIEQYYEDEVSGEANDEVGALDCAISEVIAIRAADGFSNEDLKFALRLIGLQQRSPDDFESKKIVEDFVLLLREHNVEQVAEMIMLDLLNSTSVNPEVFSRILNHLGSEGGKSRTRLRLEKLMEDLQKP